MALFECFGGVLIYDGVDKRKGWFVGGIICLVLSFGGYAASMELVAVILLGKIWLEILAGKKIDRQFVMFYLKVGLWLLVALSIYTGIISLLKLYRIVNAGMYNVQTLSVSEVMQKFLDKWNEPFKVLASSFPLDRNVMIFFGGLWVVFALLTGWRRNRFILSALISIGLVYATFGLAYITPLDSFYLYRVHSFSVPYLWGVLFAIVFLKGSVWVSNVALGCGMVILFDFFGADFEAQKIWYLGNTQNERIVERVRKQVFPLLEQGKHYRLATFGDIGRQIKFASVQDEILSAELRERYREIYPVEYFLPVCFSSGLFLYEKENPIWGDALKFSNGFFYLLSNERVEERDKIDGLLFTQDFGSDRVEMIKALPQMRPFPHPNYYFIGEKDIFLMFDDVDQDRESLYDKIMQSKAN